MDPIVPDVEILLWRYLTGHDDVADLVADQIYSVLPGDTLDWTAGVVRIVRVTGGPAMTRPLRIDKPHVQIDSWATTRARAFSVAATVNGALAELPDIGVTGDGVVNAVRIMGGPDHSFDPERPDLHRYRSSARLTVHPLATVAT